MNRLLVGCAVSLLLSGTTAEAALTVYDNVGPLNGLMAGGGSFGIINGDDYEQGVQFTSGQTVRLDHLELPLSRVVSGKGSGSALVQLRLDAGDRPGKVIESWTTPVIESLTPTFFEFDSQVGTTLAGGQKYWVTVGRATGSILGGAWYFPTLTGNALDAWRMLPNDWSTAVRRGYGTRVIGDAAMRGDANGDGRINPDDYALLDRGARQNLAGWANGDFNGDAQVNQSDRIILDVAFIQYSAGSVTTEQLVAERAAEFGPEYAAALTAAIPEPAAAGLVLGSCVAGMLGRRRRSR